MTSRAKWYTGAVILLGAILAPYAFYRYISSLVTVADLVLELQQVICLIILCTLCRSLPIMVGNGRQALDISVVSILATVAYKGTYAAVVVFLLSSLFTLDYDKESKSCHHLYNTPPVKSAFNNANLSLSIWAAGSLFTWAGGVPGQPALPYVVIPCLLFTLCAFLMNGCVLSGLFILDGKVSLEDAVSLLRGLVPNVLLAMPLGLLMTLLFVLPNGHWLAMLMLFPLLLARYAWALYVDSQQQYMRLTSAFVSAMEAKDKYTEGHSRRVQSYALMIARQINLPKAQIKELETAALLHDIGKIGVPDHILQKNGPLTPEERALIEQHPAIGVGIVEKVGLSKSIQSMIRHHHERYDGKGYPDHLDAQSNTLPAFIMAVADAYDAMTSDRPYRKGMYQDTAIRILRENSGAQFHPMAVEAFVKAMASQQVTS